MVKFNICKKLKMTKPSIVLSHLKDYFWEQNYLPERKERYAKEGDFLTRLKNKVPENEVYEVTLLIYKIQQYFPIDPQIAQQNLYYLIHILKDKDADLNHLFDTLHNPSITKLDKLMGIAEGYDKAHRDQHGSKFYSEVSDTCAAAVAILVKSIFAVIALPIAL